MEKRTMRQIAMIMAMKSEAEPLIQNLQLAKLEHVFLPGIPFEVYQGNLESAQLSLLVSGKDPDYHVDNVATIPAALMTYLAIEKFTPDLGMKTGTISTGNSLDMHDKDLQFINENQAIIKDMEAAATAWVCRTLFVPMIAVKAVTDLIDEGAPTEEQFMQNLHLAAANLQSKTIEIIQYIQKYFDRDKQTFC